MTSPKLILPADLRHLAVEPAGWLPALAHAGFMRVAAGRWQHPASGVALVIQPHWLVLAFAARPGSLAHGFWKLAANGSWCRLRLPRLLGLDSDGDAFAALLGWLVDSALGQVPHQWHPPSELQLREWLGDALVSVHAAGIVRNAVSASAGGPIFGFHFDPLFACQSTALQPARLQALRQWLADASAASLVAHVGLQETGELATVFTRVDFTGAPGLAVLYRYGIEQFARISQAVLEAACCLGNPAIILHAFDGVHQNDAPQTQPINQ